MNRVRSFMTLNALITHAYCIGCVGFREPGIGITKGYHVQAWTPRRGEPFVCTSVSINKDTTEESSSVAVSGSSAIEWTSDKTHTSQETFTGAKGTQLTLQTTSKNGLTSQLTSDSSTERTITEEFVETTLQTSSFRGISEEETHSTSEIPLQGVKGTQPTLQTTSKNKVQTINGLTSQMTSDSSTERTITDEFVGTTLQTSFRGTSEEETHPTSETSMEGAKGTQSTLQTTFKNKVKPMNGLTSQMTSDSSTEKTIAEEFVGTTLQTTFRGTSEEETQPTSETSMQALKTTTDGQTSSMPQITTDPTTEQKPTTIALETTTDRQTSSTSQVTTNTTTEQISTTVGVTALLAVDRVCNHSKPPYCYELIYEKKTYAAAYQSCRKLVVGSNLVSMVDSKEANDVKLLIVEQSSEPMEDYWIGLGKTRYSWEDGKTLLYHNFAPGYVSGMCTVMNSDDFKWKSRPCNSYEMTVCESDKGSKSCTVEFEGSCYNLLASPTTQAMAKTLCKDSGGYVLQIQRKSEQNFIQDQFSIGKDIWIGLRSDGADGFRWTDGASYEYNDFGSDYNYNFGVCFRIDYIDGFHWNDDKCDALHNFICKWNLYTSDRRS